MNGAFLTQSDTILFQVANKTFSVCLDRECRLPESLAVSSRQVGHTSAD